MRASVVVPCYNAVAYVAAAVDSALGQVGAEVEVIVVDDGSTDGSWEVLLGYGDRIRRERQDHGGAARARNRGLALATGDHVLFLDADDLLAPDTIASLGRALAAAPPRSIAAAPWQKLVRDGAGWRSAASDVPDPPGGDPLAGWLVRIYRPPCALLWPAALVRELGGWDEELTKNQDGDLAMRAFVAGARLVQGRGAPVSYRHYGASSTSVAAGSRVEDVRSCMRVLEKITAALHAAGRFEHYRVWVARGWHDLARLYYFAQPELALECARRGQDLAGARAVWGSWPHRVATWILGLERKERVAARLGRLGFGRELRRHRSAE
jgi:glycosyltransferase involved in cell wall biosynthesis